MKLATSVVLVQLLAILYQQKLPKCAVVTERVNLMCHKKIPLGWQSQFIVLHNQTSPSMCQGDVSS